MLLIINSIAFLCAIYAIPYVKMFTGQKYFYTLFFLQLAGLNGVVLAGDMFNLFVFMEVTAKASYAWWLSELEKPKSRQHLNTR